VYHWHLAGYLLNTFGYHIVHDSGFSLQSMIDVIIKNRDWFWPYARSDTLVEVQSTLHEVEIGNVDLPMWNSTRGKYNCADTWERLREEQSVVNW
jgi:hypothetical protein